MDFINKTDNSLYGNEQRSSSVDEIITSVPKWIIRWGVTIIFTILAGLVVGAALISYPEVVKAGLKVNSANSPKSVVSHQSGKLVKLLVKDGDLVKKNQILAYLETTANPEDILQLLNLVNRMKQKNLFDKESIFVNEIPSNLNLGELQPSFQSFYQDVLQFQATQKNGYLIARRGYLQKELSELKLLKLQILKQQEIQRMEYRNSEAEYKAYQKLYQSKVISRSEFTQQENKYLASKYPLQQSDMQLLNNGISYGVKEKELLEFEQTINDQKNKFSQSINKCLADIDGWMLLYTLRSPLDGRVSYAGIIQTNQPIANNQEIFVVNPGYSDFFGEIQIPQNNMGKVKIGQKVLIKLRSYPYEQFGIIRGKLTYISDVAYRDSVFISKVSFENFENKDLKKKIILKNGMYAGAEIVIEESSLLHRLFREFKKLIE